MPMKEKIILDDLTFLIPVRIESIERLENLKAAVDYILRHFSTRIIVLEAAKINNGLLKKCLSPEVTLHFVEDPDPIFHRTKYLNMLTQKATTPFIAIWDSDVIVSHSQIIQALIALKRDEADFVFPYDGMLLDTGAENRLNFLKSEDLTVLINNISSQFPLYGCYSAGGGFFAGNATYKLAGMENEKFYGWGPEDGERAKRWEILDLRIRRVKGPMFHLSHPRGVNSGMRSEEDTKKGIIEYLRICKMTKEELEYEISTWTHLGIKSLQI